MAAADCETCVLSNTVHPYELHIIICDSKLPNEWSDRVEYDPAVAMISKVVKEYSQGGQKSKEIKLTCCSFVPVIDSPSFDGSMTSLVVYPSGSIVTFHVSEEKLRDVVAGLYDAVTVNQEYSAISAAVEAACAVNDIILTSVPWGILLLVCCHMARDKRCGRAGPQIIQAFENAKEELDAGHVSILPSSHIGGHKFAGTLVVYPSGHWYGHISKSNSKELLVSILAKDPPNYKCFRGRGFENLEF
jgi:(2Fe-2S) ferredoxin